MTRREANFRSGDLNEGKSLEALREVGFVAPIPREEDTGIDAIVTLNLKKGRYLYPDRSFSVQVKSKGKNNVVWDADRTAWFMKQDLPFYWAVWDKTLNELLLYTTANLIEHTTIKQEVIFCLEPKDLYDTNEVWLGPPVAKLGSEMKQAEKDDARNILLNHINTELLIRQFKNVFALCLKYHWCQFGSPSKFQYHSQGALFGEIYDKSVGRNLPLSYIVDYGQNNLNEFQDARVLAPAACRNRVSGIASSIRMLLIQGRAENSEMPSHIKLGLTQIQLQSLSEIYELLKDKGSFIVEPPHV